VSADWRTLASSGDDDATARVWDLSAPDPHATVRVLYGERYSLDEVALSADGRTLVTAGGHGAAQVWDLGAPDQHATVRVLYGHPEGINAVVLSPDARTLYTIGGRFDPGDRTIRCWSLDPADLIAVARQTLGRNLSLREWRQHFGDAPYRRTCPDRPAGAAPPVAQIADAQQ
jgi:WD40 repeat protein